MINITVLNNELEHYEHVNSGFSVLIEAYNLRILYDTSLDNQINDNANKANIQLYNIDYIVLSHGHPDHTGGLNHLNYRYIRNVLAHPDCFEKKWGYEDGHFNGCPISVEKLEKETNVILSKKPYWIKKDRIIFLGETPRLNDFEAKKPRDSTEKRKKSYVMDDSAMAIVSQDSLIIITGCSHAGICNIVNYAEKITKKKVSVILGGFHLFDDKITDRTIDFIKNKKINKIYPAHCLSDYAFSEFKKIGAKKLKTLQTLNFVENF